MSIWFYQSVCTVGDLVVPVYPGDQISDPKNWNMPAIAGNFGNFTVGDGAKNPTGTLNHCVRDKASEVLSASFWSSMITRTNDASYDISAISGSTYNGMGFWDGARGWVGNGAKFDGFSLSCSGKGDDIRLSTRVCLTGKTTMSAPTVTPWDASNTLRFDALTFSAVAWSFNLNYSNNLSPNGALNGTQYPSAWNAGGPSASLSITREITDPIPTDGAAFAITITGSSGKTCVITCANPIWGNPDDSAVGNGRQMRTYSAQLRNASAQTLPISVAVSGF
jgi:hypothetical protein